jgi:hypothetical protein
MCGDGFGGGGADGRHVQCGSDAEDKLDAGYIREGGGSGGMMEQGGLDWSEGMQVSAWLAGVRVRGGVVVGGAAVEVRLKVRWKVHT